MTVLIGPGSYESAESIWEQIDTGLAVHGHQRVDVDEQRDSLVGTICGAGDRHATVAGTACPRSRSSCATGVHSQPPPKPP